MGFSPKKAQEALDMCDNNLERAIAHLFDEPPPPPERPSSSSSNPALNPSSSSSIPVLNPSSIPTELFPDNHLVINVSSSSASSSSASPSPASSAASSVSSVPNPRHDLILSLLSLTLRIPLFSASVSAWPYAHPLHDTLLSIIQGEPSLQAFESLLINDPSSAVLTWDDFEETIIAVFTAINDTYALSFPSTSTPSQTEGLQPHQEELETSGGIAEMPIDPSRQEVSSSRPNSASSDQSLFTNPASLLRSTVESRDEEIRKNIYVIPIAPENRSQSVQHSLASLFWSDEDTRGSLVLSHIPPIVCVQLPRRQSYRFTARDRDIYPGAFSAEFSSTVVQMHQTREQALRNSKNAARRAMHLASFEGKNIKAVLRDCCTHAQDKPHILAQVSAVEQAYEARLHKWHAAVAEHNQAYADNDPSDFDNIVQVLPQARDTCPRWRLKGVIVSPHEYCFNHDSDLWTLVLRDGTEQELSLDGVWDLLNVLDQEATSDEYAELPFLLVYASDVAFAGEQGLVELVE